jgi:hypothetical protein
MPNSYVNQNGGGNYNPLVEAIPSGLSGQKIDLEHKATLHARKLYIGGVPLGATNDDLIKFFNDSFAKAVYPEKLEGNQISQV